MTDRTSDRTGHPPSGPTAAPIRRILVALDGSPASLAALESAARLARTLDAELRGIYVEESDLLRLAEMPGLAGEVDALSGRIRPLETRRLRREIRVMGMRARRIFEERASAVDVRWSFERARGAVPAELRRVAASEVDLLVLGLRGRSPGRGAGSTVRALLKGAALPLMVLPRGARLGSAVYVAVRDPETDRRSVEVAADLARAAGASLTLLVAEDGADSEALKEIEASLSQAVAVTSETLPRLTPAELTRRLGAEACGILVLPRDLADDDVAALGPLVELLRCPVLITG